MWKCRNMLLTCWDCLILFRPALGRRAPRALLNALDAVEGSHVAVEMLGGGKSLGWLVGASD